MSWDAYVTTQLLETGAVAEGAILGEDGTLWAASSGLDVATPYTVNVTQVRGGQGDGPGAAKPGGKVELTPPRPQEDGSEQPTEVLECSLIADYARSGERPAAGLRIGKSKYLAGRAATDQDTGEAASASKRPGDLRFSLTPRDWGQVSFSTTLSALEAAPARAVRPSARPRRPSSSASGGKQRYAGSCSWKGS